MEIQLAQKLSDLDFNELVKLMMTLRIHHKEAFDALKELVDDI